MLNKELIIGVLATSVILGSFGSALAESSNDKSILGTDEFTFKALETKADVAARNYAYDLEQLTLIGTEAGGEIASMTQALHAAVNNVYDVEQSTVVGTEAGDWEYKYNDQGSGTSEVATDKRGTPSSNS
jgi:hypothetical protein